MSSAVLPKKPVENWEKVRDEWVASVDRLITDVEEWSVKQNWKTMRGAKRIEESRIGPYEVSQVVIQVPFGHLVLEPIARFVGGADGLADLLPARSGLCEAIRILKVGDDWFLSPDGDSEGPRFAWSEQTFVEAANGLAAWS